MKLIAPLVEPRRIVDTTVWTPDGSGATPPYGGTNILVPDSNDLTAIAWDQSGGPVRTLDAGNGIGGEDQTNIADDSTLLEYMLSWTNVTAGTEYYTARYFIKKNTVEFSPPYAEFHLRFNATEAATITGDGVALGVNLSTGATAYRVTTNTGGNHDSSVETYAGDSNYWEIKIHAPNTSKAWVGIALMPAASNTLGGALDSNPTADIDVANVEMFANVQITDVVGGPVYN